MFDSKLYKETFSQVRASEETLSEVLNMAKQKQNTGARLTRLLVIAAVISAMLATTAFAYVGFTQYENPMEMLGTFFGNTSKESTDGGIVHETYFDQEYDYVQPTIERVPLDDNVAQEQVAPYISGVGGSVTYGDYTLTVEAQLYDSATDCGIIYYTLENPNGVRGYETQLDGEVWWPGGELVYISDIGNGKGTYIIEDQTTDTKLAIAFYYCGANGLDYVNVAFYADRSNALTLPLNDGGGMECITVADGEIRLSPIAIRVYAENMGFLYTNLDIYCDVSSLVLRYKDGTEYVIYSDEPFIDNSTYALNNFDGTVVSYTFNRLVDIDAVEAVIINDVEYTDIQVLAADSRGDISGYGGESLPAATEPVTP